MQRKVKTSSGVISGSGRPSETTYRLDSWQTSRMRFSEKNSMTNSKEVTPDLEKFAFGKMSSGLAGQRPGLFYSKRCPLAAPAGSLLSLLLLSSAAALTFNERTWRWASSTRPSSSSPTRQRVRHGGGARLMTAASSSLLSSSSSTINLTMIVDLKWCLHITPPVSIFVPHHFLGGHLRPVETFQHRARKIPT